MSLHTLTIHGLREKLRTGEVSARQATQAVLDRIKAVDGKINAYLWLNPEDALAQADAIDRSGAAKNGKPLGGVPIAIKDVINVEGQPCTCASKILKGYTSVYDATVTQRLREAGGCCWGDEHRRVRHGQFDGELQFGTTKNPWDLTRIPGGSSGGSGAAVAADEAIAALEAIRAGRSGNRRRCAGAWD